jgi:hypothetical protein
MKKATHFANLRDFMNLRDATDEMRLKVHNFRTIGIALTVHIMTDNTRSGRPRCVKIVK